MKLNLSRLGCLCAVAAAAALAGCTPSTASHATTSQTSTISTPTPPPSIPAAFPDLTSYTEVNPQDYRESYPYFNGIKFRTPGGQTCDHNSMNSLSDPENKVLSCTGPSGDKGPGNWSVDVATKEAATIEKAAAPGNPDYKPREEDLPAVLPTRHKIVYEGVTCAAGDDGSTACHVGTHGFIITPASTTLF